MDKKSLVAAAVVLVVIAGAVVAALSFQPLKEASDDRQGGTTEQTTIPESDQDTAVNGEKATITFTDQGFTPQEITVKKGTIITVTNSSDRDVKFSSDDHPTHVDNPEMNLDMLAPGESASYTANTPGTHPYHDHEDESLTGTVIVTD